MVSTHSHPKAAAHPNLTAPAYGWVFQHTAARRRLLSHKRSAIQLDRVSTHSRPKAAAKTLPHTLRAALVSTHSRPKAAAKRIIVDDSMPIVSTHSRPKAAALPISFTLPAWTEFQHTAARRRLPPIEQCHDSRIGVSTHSRPKAAAAKPA